jgi:predicted short-subunit dehydrogenase-like oxidoreductase (DUF2520 family)
MNPKSVSIIGTGVLGSVLARAFHRISWPVKSLYSRSPESLKKLAKETEVQKTGVFPSGKQDLGNFVFLTVPDRAIEEIAEKLAALGDDFSATTVAHCSGSKSSAALKALQEKGAQTAAFHPIQTFIQTSQPSDFQSIYIDIEGDEKAVQLLKNIAAQLGGKPLQITPGAKPYLHAAGVMASNYLNALLASACQIAELGGLDKNMAQQALLPLMQKSLANILESDHLPNALSGPIVRGDTSTVADHLKLLEQNPQLSSLYKKLGAVLIQLLEDDGRNSHLKMREMTDILNEE